MSIDMRYVTNGTKTGYYVRDELNETVNFHENKSDIPEGIRHYAPDGEPRYWGPDMARIMRCQKLLYPEFPKPCGLAEYEDAECIAESCKYAPNGDWNKCPYFPGSNEELCE